MPDQILNKAGLLDPPRLHLLRAKSDALRHLASGGQRLYQRAVSVGRSRRIRLLARLHTSNVDLVSAQTGLRVPLTLQVVRPVLKDLARAAFIVSRAVLRRVLTHLT